MNIKKQPRSLYVKMGFKLWNARQKEKCSVYEMARRLQLSVERYRELERGEDQPSLAEKSKIEKSIEVNANPMNSFCFLLDFTR